MDHCTSEPPQKTCTKCGIEKPATLEYFSPGKKYTNGLYSQCRICRAIDKRIRRASKTDEQREPERKKNRDRMNKRYRDDPEFAERAKQNNSENQKRPEVKERMNARARERRRTDPKFVQGETQRAQKYGQSEKGRKTKTAAKQRRRAREYELPDSFTNSDWERALAYFGNKCAVCGRSADFWTVLAADHWYPLSRENSLGTIPANMIPLCHTRPKAPAGNPSCNTSKSNKMPDEWLIAQFGKRKAKQIMKRIESYFESLTDD